ncbi:2-hydroxyacid dehydrogenase [Bacillus sp. MB2021]|uniref:2-hydroxyacid dehydrogenase n=1 Tax=Bacillus sp. MB2021 TaxID=1408303 RepID=UPI00128C6EB9|nr:NAD(P)-dependent oxidoreductase [Bacillus sp. MB2021]
MQTKSQMPLSIEYLEDCSKQEFLRKMVDVDIFLTSFMVVDEEVMQHAKRLKLIVICATGFGNIDIVSAKKYGIKVCPIREYCTQEVADHTLLLLLASARKLNAYEEKVYQEKNWDYDVPNVICLHDKTLAIYGFGRIGQAVANRAKAFGMHVIVYHPHFPEELARQLGVELVKEKEIFQRADIISNHMSENASNVGKFNQLFFSQLKKEPIFINAGRGSAVNEPDLKEALEKHHLSFAALDVLSSEHPDLENHPLFKRADVLLTPHAAFYSEDSQKKLLDVPLGQILSFLNGKESELYNVAK